MQLLNGNKPPAVGGLGRNDHLLCSLLYLAVLLSLEDSEEEISTTDGTGLGCKYKMSLPNSVCKVPHFINKLSQVDNLFCWAKVVARTTLKQNHTPEDKIAMTYV